MGSQGTVWSGGSGRHGGRCWEWGRFCVLEVVFLHSVRSLKLGCLEYIRRMPGGENGIPFLFKIHCWRDSPEDLVHLCYVQAG